jgi:hypothetical protein
MKTQWRLWCALLPLVPVSDTSDRFAFVDIATQSGLTVPNTVGGRDKKESILESTGTGAAIFDFDGDGSNDIFIANGPPSHSELYKNAWSRESVGYAGPVELREARRLDH